MKTTAIALVLAFAPLVIHAQEGTVFPKTKLNSEESGYVEIFAAGVLDVTTDCYNSYRCYTYSKMYAELGDPGNSNAWHDSFLGHARSARAAAKKLTKDLEYYTPPTRFEKVHLAIHEFAIDKDRPMEERAPSCLRVYTEANDLKYELLRSPDLWTPTRTGPAPAGPVDVIFSPVGLPIRYNLTKGTFSLATAFQTPIGSLTFSLPITPPPGVTRESAKIVVLEYEGRARAFALDRAINLVTKPDFPLMFDGFHYTTDRGHAVIRIRRANPTDLRMGAGTVKQQMSSSAEDRVAPLKAIEVSEEEAAAAE